jgi:hypothetical protein
MGKKVEQTSQEGFDLLEEESQHERNQSTQTNGQDIYNLLGSLKLQYNIKKSKTGKINISLNLTSKEQLNVLLNNLQKVQNTLSNGEYIVVVIAQRVPYSLSLVITRSSTILKISYLSGYVKGTNMSIPISISTINSLQAILTALSNSELGKKLLSISTLSNTSQNSENLL